MPARRFTKITDHRGRTLLYEHYASNGSQGMELVATFTREADADAFMAAVN